MIKLILLLSLFTISMPIMAQSCWPLYEAKAKKIQEIKAFKTQIGAALVNRNGKVGFWPGVEVDGKVDNWAKDLIDAIKWGPYKYNFGHDEDPRKDWLKALSKSISRDCKMNKGNYVQLQDMLKELMDDGSFCPNNKILGTNFLTRKSDFKRVLKSAVKDQRFVEICQGVSVVDDSHREVKDVSSSPSHKRTHSSGKQ